MRADLLCIALAGGRSSILPRVGGAGDLLALSALRRAYKPIKNPQPSHVGGPGRIQGLLAPYGDQKPEKALHAKIKMLTLLALTLSTQPVSAATDSHDPGYGMCHQATPGPHLVRRFVGLLCRLRACDRTIFAALFGRLLPHVRRHDLHCTGHDAPGRLRKLCARKKVKGTEIFHG